MAQDGHKDAVGVVRIHDDGGDLLAVAQAQVPPRLAGVGGSVHAVAHREVRPLQPFARAHVDRVGVRRRHRHAPMEPVG